MNRTLLVTLGVVAVCAVGVGAWKNGRNHNDNNSAAEDAMKRQDDAMMKDDDTESMMNDKQPVSGTMMEGDETMMKNDDKMEGDAMSMEETHLREDRYVDYSEAAYAATADAKRILFFHAAWCPTCKVANAAFEASPRSIPEDVVVLKTDYDTERALKQRYGITYQHTFVQVDAEGNQLAKWNGGDLDALKDNLI